MIRQYELVERVRAYDEDLDENLLNRAYVFSMKAHGKQIRASGDPYFSHPLEVAGILTKMQLDSATIITALLHDTIEDTVATYEQLEELFGEEVAKLVDGVTKLSQIEVMSESAKQAENFRKFLLAMSNDIRVLLVKLADRLHNMRMLNHIKKPEKQIRIARETLEIYAPLAERIGMHEMKDELEDLAFRYLHPEARESIIKRLEFLYANSEEVREKVIVQLGYALKEGGIDAEVNGRLKRPYSIWRKMELRHISFEQLSDIVAFRIIVDDIPTCYRVMGIVHGKWPAVPSLFKDYISTPKPNGYRSLRTAVLGPELQRIEIQIRTAEMHATAELGVAAHWQYKQHSDDQEGEQYKWLRELLEILEHGSSPEEFLEHTKLSMYRDKVFCFTPKGDLIALPMGATVVDFAYAVHSEVGDTCVGAKVNKKTVPLRAVLKNGDQVEILRSKAQTPSPGWESFVITGKARSAIRRFIRHQQKTEYIALGRTILERAFRKEKREFSDKAFEQAAQKLQYANVDELLVDVGAGLVSERRVLELVFPGVKLVGEYHNQAIHQEEDAIPTAIPIRGLTPGMAVHLSECCHPLPGDRIVGIVTPGKGIMVHTIDCEALEAFAEVPESWLDISWYASEDINAVYVGRLDIYISHEPGALASLATVVARDMGNISNLKFVERKPDFFRVEVDIEVRDVKHLVSIIAALRATPSVNAVERIHG